MAPPSKKSVRGVTILFVKIWDSSHTAKMYWPTRILVVSAEVTAWSANVLIQLYHCSDSVRQSNDVEC